MPENSMSDQSIIESFKELKTRKDIASILNIDDKELRYLLFASKEENLYHEFKIKKTSGLERTICAPNGRLKIILRKLASILNLVYNPKICAYGFIKGKNIIGNAENHVKPYILLNVDLKDFFNQIHFGRVRGMFNNPPYNLGIEAATTIAQLVCYKGTLPQGSPCSPIITNMICAPLDNQLIKIARKYKLKYTRYADDISFSTFEKSFPKSIISGDSNDLSIGNELNGVFAKNSFIVNENKIFLNSKRTRQEVTGLIVNEKINIKREYTRVLRAILHNCNTDGIYETATAYINKGFCKNKDILTKADDKKVVCNWFKQVIKGKINYIRHIKGDTSPTFLDLAMKMNGVFAEEVFDNNIIISPGYQKIIDSMFILETNCNTASAIFLLNRGFLTSLHTVDKEKIVMINKHDGYKKIKQFTQDPNNMEANKDIIAFDKDLDYIFYKFDGELPPPFPIGNSNKLKQGDYVKIMGFPNYRKGDTLYSQEGTITSIKEKVLGSPLYTVSARVSLGMSGGMVLNKKSEIIGMIKAGSNEDESTEYQGFVPIHLILEDIEKKSPKEATHQ